MLRHMDPESFVKADEDRNCNVTQGVVYGSNIAHLDKGHSLRLILINVLFCGSKLISRLVLLSIPNLQIGYFGSKLCWSFGHMVMFFIMVVDS